MKRLTTVLFSVFVACLAVGLSAGEAEAKRLGGGGSFGMQRQSVAPRPAPVPYRQAAPASPAPATPAPAPATPKRSWLGPLALAEMNRIEPRTSDTVNARTVSRAAVPAL